jgi:hypothetical protein
MSLLQHSTFSDVIPKSEAHRFSFRILSFCSSWRAGSCTRRLGNNLMLVDSFCVPDCGVLDCVKEYCSTRSICLLLISELAMLLTFHAILHTCHRFSGVVSYSRRQISATTSRSSLLFERMHKALCTSEHKKWMVLECMRISCTPRPCLARHQVPATSEW